MNQLDVARSLVQAEANELRRQGDLFWSRGANQAAEQAYYQARRLHHIAKLLMAEAREQ